MQFRSAALCSVAAILLTVTLRTAFAQTPPRDGTGSPAPAGTAVITGRILTLDSNRPLKRAVVRVTIQEAQGGGGSAVTDGTGRYEIRDLRAGRYTIAASKAGYVTLAYGQRRPLAPATPVSISNGQRVEIDLKLPKGSVIAGRVLDEDAEPVPGATVRAFRFDTNKVSARWRRSAAISRTIAGRTASTA